MALPRNKLIPILGVFALLVVGYIGYRAVSSSDAPVSAGSRLSKVPNPSTPASGSEGGGIFGIGQQPKADGDKPTETLNTLTARLSDNDKNMSKLENDNKLMRGELEQLRARFGTGNVSSPAPSSGTVSSAAPGAAASGVDRGAPPDALERGISSVVDTFDALTSRSRPATRNDAGVAPNGMPPGLGFDGLQSPMPGSNVQGLGVASSTNYTTLKPMGYEDRGEKNRSGGGPRYVRTTAGSAGMGTLDVRPAAPEVEEKKSDQPYFTIPENATMTRVVAMTAVVGRVPIDGRVQDPMQFKAIIGRENLAANGWYVPDDVSGIVVSGTAVGDMTMSCSEGHIHSMTFVFDDGAIRTVSTRKGSSGTTRDKALGYISDEFGNPCISGQFVSNAPAYLTDVVGLKTLSTASKAYSAAQTSTTDSSLTGTSTSSVTGNRGAFVLGQAAASGIDEVSNWLFARMKNSFDAVVTPAGRRIVIHIDQEIAIDKVVNPRRLDHTRSVSQNNGGHHGLD